MTEDIKSFIAQCPVCQKQSLIKAKPVTAPFTRSTYEVMKSLAIDTAGPFTPDELGNEYIVVIIDQFSRFVTLHATPDSSAKSAARALLQHYGFFGQSDELRSDNGSQYINTIVKELNTITNTEHFTGLAYSSEENSIVERVIRELNRHIQAIIYDVNVIDNWSTLLPLVQRILNATVHSSLGFSPADLVLNPLLDLNRNIFTTTVDHPIDKDFSEWQSMLLEKQALLIHLTQKHRKEADAKNIGKRTASQPLTEYPVGSYVLLRYVDRPPSKLHTPWQGPFRVISFVKSNYTIENQVTRKTYTVHVSRLKLFNTDSGVSPKDVARHDYQEFVVEKILGHKGNPTQYGKMEFNVRWLGYGVEDDLWEQWKELRDNPALHKYLYENGMKRLIPKEHVRPDGDYSYSFDDFTN